LSNGGNPARHAPDFVVPTTMLRDVLEALERPPDTRDDIEIVGRDPKLPTRFRIGEAGAATLAAVGLTVSDLWAMRSGRTQRIRIETSAAAGALRSSGYLRCENARPPTAWDAISGFYQTRDDHWVQLHCNFPHLRDGVLAVLGRDNEREAVETAVRDWNAKELEEVCVERGLCVSLVREPGEWAAEPQAAAVDGLPLMEIAKIGDSDPEPLPDGARPLSGIRVLDLSRVLAGPTCGRTLAEHGATVMRISAPRLPSIESLVMDTGHGKLAAHVDLETKEGVSTLRALVSEGDVFSQAYRPGALDARGFSPADLASLRPGVIYVTLSAFGHVGPMRGRRGYDTLVQSATGIAAEHGGPAQPRHLPASALDYITGYLAAAGAMRSLALRAEQGGSYLVRVSLCQTAHWLKRLPRVEAEDVPRLDVEHLMTSSDTPFGRLTHLGPVLELSETPPYWERPTVPLGTHPAEWP
jgi:crotonobetainyl-CoA:carnitine CoA-transferase CaiB-like acyl-CoA transferase